MSIDKKTFVGARRIWAHPISYAKKLLPWGFVMYSFSFDDRKLHEGNWELGGFDGEAVISSLQEERGVVCNWMQVKTCQKTKQPSSWSKANKIWWQNDANKEFYKELFNSMLQIHVMIITSVKKSATSYKQYMKIKKDYVNLKKSWELQKVSHNRQPCSKLLRIYSLGG